MKTADEILNASKCGDIFSQGDERIVKAEYRQMARAYHPDICTLPNASKVFAKLNKMIRSFPSNIILSMLGYEKIEATYTDYGAPVDAPQNLFD